MSWFKRKKDDVQIPPVAAPPSIASSDGPPSYRSNASTYIRSRDGDLDGGSSYGNNSYGASNSYGRFNRTHSNDSYGAPPASGGDSYSGYSRERSNQYGRSDPGLDATRNRLFEGAAPVGQGYNKYATDGPGGELPESTGNEDEDVEAIKQQTRFLKQDTVQSSRNALRIAQEAEETGRATLLRLGDQSERLANTERHLDVSKGHSQRADDNASEIKKLNRSIFIPVVTLNKDKKRREQDMRREQRFLEEQSERERSMLEVRDSQNRLGRAATYGGDDDEGIGYRRAGRSDAERKQARSRYQFEATASDDELEDELDDNMDQIADAASRLNKLALAMGQEVTSQNDRLDRIAGKTDKLTMRIDNNTDKLKRIK